MGDTNTNGTALTTIKPEAITEIIGTAPGALQRNRTSIQNAQSAGQAILDTIEREGMNDLLDSRCNNYLVKVRKTAEEMMERRKPITQIFDAVKKEFTNLESALDPKNGNSIYARIQSKRDKYAADKIEQQRKKEAEIQRQLNLEKERISIRNEATLELRMYFDNYLSQQRSMLTGIMNNMTLKDFAAQKKSIEQFSEEYPTMHFNVWTSNLYPRYLSPEERDEIFAALKLGKYEEFAVEFKLSISEMKTAMLDRLPGKKKLLEDMEKASADKKKKMEAEQSRIKAEAEAREKAEAAERERKAREESERKKLSETTEALFEATGELQFNQQAQVRESYEIEVLNPMGYLLITQFYFEKEGKNEPIEKLEKKSLGSMKTFCERWAMKNDEKINSAYLKYNEKFKTVAKK